MCRLGGERPVASGKEGVEGWSATVPNGDGRFFGSGKTGVRSGAWHNLQRLRPQHHFFQTLPLRVLNLSRRRFRIEALIHSRG